jgi:hypothetical protein
MRATKVLSAALETVIRVTQRDPGGGNEHTIWCSTDGSKQMTEQSPVWLVEACELLDREAKNNALVTGWLCRCLELLKSLNTTFGAYGHFPVDDYVRIFNAANAAAMGQRTEPAPPDWLVTPAEFDAARVEQLEAEVKELKVWKHVAITGIRELRGNISPCYEEQQQPLVESRKYWITSAGSVALARMEQLLNHE